MIRSTHSAYELFNTEQMGLDQKGRWPTRILAFILVRVSFFFPIFLTHFAPLAALLSAGLLEEIYEDTLSVK